MAKQFGIERPSFYKITLLTCNTSKTPGETLIRAKYTRQRHGLLDKANLMLEVLRFQTRLAKDLQCLKVESYAFASQAIDEIGKLVSGWLKSVGPAT